MALRHPALPDDRPLMIAHRAGNSVALANEALAAGADMIETDVWRFRKRLEIRHIKTMGPVPLLWDRWELHPGWGPRFQLRGLIQEMPADCRIFLDLKGEDLSLGPEVVDTIRGVQPERRIVVCGRTWRQLDQIADDPAVTVFYSVGSDDELANIWDKLREMRNPAVSINCRYLTPELMRRLKDAGATVVSWTINTIESASRLHEMGVDGFTTDNLDLVRQVSRLRAKAFDDVPAPDPTVARDQRA